jgi:hypothetical protein
VAAQFVLALGIVRLVGSLYVAERGALLATWLSYAIEFAYFSFEVIVKSIPSDRTAHSKAMCLLPPFSNVVNTCSLRTVVGALGICTVMMVWVGMACRQLPHLPTRLNKRKRQ